jgi:hypothetical protein
MLVVDMSWNQRILKTSSVVVVSLEQREMMVRPLQMQDIPVFEKVMISVIQNMKEEIIPLIVEN